MRFKKLLFAVIFVAVISNMSVIGSINNIEPLMKKNSSTISEILPPGPKPCRIADVLPPGPRPRKIIIADVLPPGPRPACPIPTGTNPETDCTSKTNI